MPRAFVGGNPNTALKAEPLDELWVGSVRRKLFRDSNGVVPDHPEHLGKRPVWQAGIYQDE